MHCTLLCAVASNVTLYYIITLQLAGEGGGGGRNHVNDGSHEHMYGFFLPWLHLF